jgi:hypothetical protein
LCQVGLSGGGEVGEAVFEPPAGAVDGDDLAVVQEAVQDGGGENFVGEDLAPFIRSSHVLILMDPDWYLGYLPSGVSADL